MELKHASAYLPYDVKVYDIGTNKVFSTPLNLKTIEYLVENIYKDSLLKLVLRPLSDLTKEIEHNGEKFVPINGLKHFYGFEYMWSYVSNKKVDFNPHAVCLASINKLLEWHFDIFGLIPQGKAIDINTLNK